MQLLKRLLACLLMIGVSACGSTTGPSDVTPLPTDAPSATSTTPASNTTNWNITQTFASVEGPDNCWVRFQRARLTGAVFPNLDTVITRTDGAIRFDSQWFQVNYAGTYSGLEFTATGVAPLTGSVRGCDGMSFEQLPGTSNLTGQFTDTDQSL